MDHPREQARETTFRGLIGEVIDNVTLLVRQELRLAQAEAVEKLGRAQTSVVSILGGMMLAFCALLILLEAAVAALATRMPAWAAALIVSAALVIAAAVLVKRGQAALKAQSFKPRHSLHSLKKDKDMVAEKLS